MSGSVLTRSSKSAQTSRIVSLLRALRFLGPLLLLVTIAVGIRFHNLTDVLVGGRFYFVDADCYSRMSRVQMVSDAPGTVIHHQNFENWPEGVDSHATAPMDYAIVALERVLRWIWPGTGRLSALKKSSLDLAGALISPLLGVFLCVFLGLWAAKGSAAPQKTFCWWTVPLLAAISPPVVHATVLGRPDHQSLLLLLVAIALGAEQRLQQESSFTWAWTGGLAWGGSLWVSLYEPLVLLGLVLVLGIWPWRASWTISVRARWGAAILLLLVCGWLVDGIRFVFPDPQWNEALKRWGSSIGELQSIESIGVLGSWTGWLVWMAPTALLRGVRREGKPSVGWLILLLCLAGLARWQLRWSPFFALGFILCLPLILSSSRLSLVIGAVFLASLWPVFVEWERRLFPDGYTVEQHYLERSERINARLAAERMRSTERRPFLAVWWHSPALAYWSGQPAVAGSGHEGIAGIVDSARFFLATDPREAREILERRKVSVVVASDSARATENSAVIVGKIPGEKVLAEKLWGTRLDEEWGLEGETNVTTFRLLRVH